MLEYRNDSHQRDKRLQSKIQNKRLLLNIQLPFTTEYHYLLFTLYLSAVREPATIVIAPAQPEHTSGGRLTLTCAAYGEPLPIITWSLPSMGIMNFSELAEQSDSVNINTTEIDGLFVVSLLELCDVNYTSNWLLGGFVCEADNGVVDGGSPLGVSRVTLQSLTPVGMS